MNSEKYSIARNQVTVSFQHLYCRVHHAYMHHTVTESLIMIYRHIEMNYLSALDYFKMSES